VPIPNACSRPHQTDLESSDDASQLPIIDYFAQDLSHNLAIQQSFDLLASGGLNNGTQAFCAPGLQNRGQEVTPRQLDVRPNCEPVGHDQAIAVPAPAPALQESLPLAVERNPDNGTIA